MPISLKHFRIIVLQKNGNRIYKVGATYIQVPKIVINEIRSLATKPFDTAARYDKKVVDLLLIICVGTKNVTDDKITQPVRDFVGGNISSVQGLDYGDYM